MQVERQSKDYYAAAELLSHCSRGSTFHGTFPKIDEQNLFATVTQNVFMYN